MTSPTLTPFNARWGTRQGRIKPVNWTAPLGAYVLCLGDDLPGTTGLLRNGDELDVSQLADFSSLSFVRYLARLRPPSTVPAGCAWFLDVLLTSIVLDSPVTVIQSLPLLPGRTRDLRDLGINIGSGSTAPGGASSTLTFRLRFTAPTGLFEPELPGVYVDAVALAGPLGLGPVLLNRNPEPNETRVPAGTSVYLEVHAEGSTSIALASLNITIDGAPAVIAGTIQPGFNGGGSSIAAMGAGVAVTLIPAVPYASLAVSMVRVRANLTGAGGIQLDQTYSFTVADTMGPELTNVVATDQKIIAVNWGEAVLASGDGSSADGLAASNYSLQFIGVPPAVTPRIASVALTSASSAVLTTDIEMTPGAEYVLLVMGVQDLFGNASLAPGNQALFSGFAAQPVPGRRFDIYGFFAGVLQNMDVDVGDLRSFTAVMQEPVNVLLAKLDRFPLLLDPDTAPDDWLDLFLFDAGNPFNFELAAVDKHRLLTVLGPLYRLKGTDPGVIDAIRFFLGIEVTITTPSSLSDDELLGVGTLGSTFATGGTLVLGSGALSDVYHFVVHVPVSLTDTQRSQMDAVIRYMMRAGTSYELDEPEPPPTSPNHAVLGLSRLNLNFALHTA